MKMSSAGASVKINSSNIHLGEDLPQKVHEKLLQVAGMYCGHLNHAVVGFSREGHSYCCIINVQVGNYRVLIAEAYAADCHDAFEQALGNIEKQLRRRKHRMLHADRGHMSMQAHA